MSRFALRRLATVGVLSGVLSLAMAAPASAVGLTEALYFAAAYDPAVAESLAAYDADREAGFQDSGSLLPSVTLNASGDWGRSRSNGIFGSTDEEFPAWQAAIEIRQPLFRLDWGARRARAGALDDLADARLADRRQQLLLRVAEGYFQVLLAQDALALAEAEARAVRESLDDIQKRHDVGMVPGTDLKEAQARDDLAQARLLAAERDLASMRDVLADITGHTDLELPRLPEDSDFPPLLPADAGAWVEFARETSPQLQVARHDLEIGLANVQSRRAERMPTLDAVGRAGRVDTSEFSFGQTQDDARIGLELRVPIYSGTTSASLREAEAREREIRARLDRLTLDVQRSTRQAYRNVNTGYREIAAFARALDSARAAEVATRNGYEAGTRTISDVLDAHSRVVGAQGELNRARYNLLLGILRLKQTAGVLTEQDFTEIDRLLRVADAGHRHN